MGDHEPSESVRKSGRTRQPNRKYANEAFTGLEVLEVLDSLSDQEVEAWQQLEQRSSDDEEFDEVQAVNEEANDLEEDVISLAESEGSDIETPNEDPDDVVSDPDAVDVKDGSTQNHSQAKIHSLAERKRRARREGTHVRGIAELVKYHAKGPKDEYIYSLFGSATQDLLHMARTRDQWVYDATLPRRPNESGSRGMHRLFSHTEEKRQMEATVGWDWYYNHGGQQHMANVQTSHPMSTDEGVKYVPRSSDVPRTIFMGPYGRQSRFDLPILQSMTVDEAWKQVAPQNDTESNGPGRPRSHKRKGGWMLNVGTSVRCAEWAPNHTGDTQYLAISNLQSKSNQKFGQSKFSPAFTAQSFPSSIQIWSFSSTEAPDRRIHLNPDRPPHLRLVICTDWGDAKHLRWCPMPRNFRNKGQGGKFPIGMLACVWSDGHVRVIDIHLDQSEIQDTNFIKLTSAAFTAKPPSTLCTCVTWLSPTDLAVGCANGYLTLWSIYPYPPPSSIFSSSPRPSSSTKTPKPRLYTPLHASYISSLCTAYPLAPHLLATTSPTGHLRLTSLLAPQTDYVLSPRLRHPPLHIHFSEPCHAFVAADETESLRLWPLRRFFSPISVARCPSQGLAIGVGSVHASVVVGCVDGTVCVTNPLRKFLFPKLKSWQCPVFKHEFARRGPAKDGDGEEQGGRVRITEGYKAQEAALLMGTGKKSVEGVVVATVYEEEGQARCVSWGKELKVGGWVAVGFGSGLIRVEDLAV
ncbi:MAG: hypothetical protein Q9166_002502 [cf. Caloplaca sp. 2 TL-2023]